MRQSKEQLLREISELKMTNQVLEERNAGLRATISNIKKIAEV